ncbi:MAG: hypothetical protein ACPGJS_17040 [Flammeovirgaceae bacterium]
MNSNKLILLILGLLLLGACSSKDSQKEQAEALAEKERLLLEKEKELAEREGALKKGQQEEANLELTAKLVSLWFSSTTPYAFDENAAQQITVNGKSYGMFGMGLFTAKAYGLTSAMDKYMGNETNEAIPLAKSLQNLSGKSPYLTSFRYDSYFKGINPAFLDWAAQLVPKPEARLMGYKAQDFYERVFKRMARIYTLTRLYLTKNMDFQSEATAYANNFSNRPEDDFYGPSYLYDKYGNLLNQFDVESYEELEADQAFGFWLRRKLDGSDLACWTHLERIMLDYDNEWFMQYNRMEKIELEEFSKEDLAEIYACFFKNPYEYMFEGAYDEDDSDELKVGNTYYGRFTAGINGILFYGRLDDCMMNFMINKYPEAVEEGEEADGLMTGYTITHGAAILKTKEEAGFRHFNPDFITWAGATMVPEPTDQILGHTYQALYDRIFQRFFRTMAVSYQYIQEVRDFEEEYLNYSRNAENPDFRALTYLDERFGEALPEYTIESDSDAWTPQMAIGFWLRRGIDGTADELWTELQRALEKYDSEWLANEMH